MKSKLFYLILIIYICYLVGYLFLGRCEGYNISYWDGDTLLHWLIVSGVFAIATVWCILIILSGGEDEW